MVDSFLAVEYVTLGAYDSDEFSLATKVFTKRILRDRFCLLNERSNYKFSEVPTGIPSPCERCFSDIMDEVAWELVSSYYKIAVSWSGGLDSTAVLVALLRALGCDSYHRLSVFCTEGSIEEAPNFYKLLKKLGIHVVVDYNLLDAIGATKCDVITTGCGADSFFASTTLGASPSLYHMPVVEGIRAAWGQNNQCSVLTRKQAVDIADMFGFYASAMGIDAKYFCDIAWLFEFGCRYTNGSEKLHMLLGGQPNCEKCKAFFLHPLFSQWAIGRFYINRRTNPYLEPTEYKAELRQYIYEFDHDVVYNQTKQKANSLLTMALPSKAINILTLDGVVSINNGKGLRQVCNMEEVRDMLRKSSEKRS